MPRFECFSILEAGSFTTDSGTVIVPSGEEPFPIEIWVYALIFLDARNSQNVAVCCY